MSSDLEKCNHASGCECHKNPLLERVGLVPVGVCRSLVRNPAGMELPLRRLLRSLTGRDSGLDLALEGRGTLHAVGGSSSPRRARTAT